MTVKVIVFDFDGTIADTQEAIIQIANYLAGEFDYDPIEPEKVPHLRNLNSKEVLRQSKIPAWKVPFLLRRVRLELTKQIEQLKPIPGIEKVLFYLKSRDYHLGIVTSNSRDNVNVFLKQNQLENLFDFICTGISLFGKDRIINKLIRQTQLSPDTILYVGDETRDIVAARKSKVKVVAVSWGFNTRQALREYQPDFLIDEPQQLMHIISGEPGRFVISRP